MTFSVPFEIGSYFPAADGRLVHFCMHTYKGKAIPLQAWTDPEGSRRLRVPDFKTIGT